MTHSIIRNIELKNSIPAQIRLLCKSDKPLIVEGFKRLSERSRYNRFFRHIRKLTEKQLEYFTNIDYINHFALGVNDQSKELDNGIGIGRYIKMPDSDDTAELAITVTDDYQHLGAGKILLNQLVQVARDNGFKKFVGFSMPDNRKVLKLLEQFKPKLFFQPESIYRIEFEL